MTQLARRRDPYPWTWELPVGVLFTVGLVLTCAVHLGRAVANLLAGAGWQFPPRTALFSSLPGVLGGNPAAGLVGVHHQLASDTALWMWVAAAELLMLTVSAVGIKIGLDRWGPARMKGMASRTEAEHLLGMSRLRHNRSIIRPDLFNTDLSNTDTSRSDLYTSSSNRWWR